LTTTEIGGKSFVAGAISHKNETIFPVITLHLLLPVGRFCDTNHKSSAVPRTPRCTIVIIRVSASMTIVLIWIIRSPRRKAGLLTLLWVADPASISNRI
jgi:hypothetical protein